MNWKECVSVCECNVRICMYALQPSVAKAFEGFRRIFCNENVACTLCAVYKPYTLQFNVTLLCKKSKKKPYLVFTSLLLTIKEFNMFIIISVLHTWFCFCLFFVCSMPVSTFGVTPAVGGLSSGTVGEASTALSSAAQVALQSLSHAMASAEQQLQVLQEKQQQLLKLQQQVGGYLAIF